MLVNFKSVNVEFVLMSNCNVLMRFVLLRFNTFVVKGSNLVRGRVRVRDRARVRVRGRVRVRDRIKG